MKFSLLVLPLCALTLPASATSAEPDTEVKLQELRDIGKLPEDKLAYRPEERLDTKRPNPFAGVSKVTAIDPAAAVETEESKIRGVFESISISGITEFNGHYTALLGDLILEEGVQIPPVIPGQTQILRVTRVTPKLVEIAWVEGAGSETVTPRKIVKRVELSPRVGVLLAAQPPGTTDSNAMTYVDENGKVSWPGKMAPVLGGIMGNLPAPTSTAALSPAEEAALMEPPGLSSPASATPVPEVFGNGPPPTVGADIPSQLPAGKTSTDLPPDAGVEDRPTEEDPGATQDQPDMEPAHED